MNNENLYEKIISFKNLIFAYQKAKKGKTKKFYVKDFEENLAYNLKVLYDKLKNQTYKPRPLKTFILRDPKTRKISKSDFRDRIVHHALIKVIEPTFDKTFIYDSCANRKGKGTLFALQRFEIFKRKVTNNLQTEAFCLKADIKHYFQEVDREILLKIIQRKITDDRVVGLIILIINNFEENCGMPLGNLTSQFFANVYLNELDRFVKHKLKVKYYIRYVDDFVILHKSKYQLKFWKEEINIFLKEKLKLELHPEKSKIISLSKGVDFVGFRNFYYCRLLRNRNIQKIKSRINEFKEGKISEKKFRETLQGWLAYAKWSNDYNLIIKLLAKPLKEEDIW
jgi:retron-type reverse transcriptase